MKHLSIILLLFTLASTELDAQLKNERPDTVQSHLDPVLRDRAIDISLKFFELLTDKDTVPTLESCATVPFALDRKLIIKEYAVLQSEVDTIREKTSHYDFCKIESIQVIGQRSEILDGLVPLVYYYVKAHIVVKVGSEESRDTIVFAVKMDEEPLVVGFTD